jgi:hypothetical protein
MRGAECFRMLPARPDRGGKRLLDIEWMRQAGLTWGVIWLLERVGSPQPVLSPCRIAILPHSR